MYWDGEGGVDVYVGGLEDEEFACLENGWLGGSVDSDSFSLFPFPFSLFRCCCCRCLSVGGRGIPGCGLRAQECKKKKKVKQLGL